MRNKPRRTAVLALLVLGVFAFVLANANRASASSSDSVTYIYDKDSPVAQATATLRVVVVGFTKGQIDEQALIKQIPLLQRPGVLIPYDADAAGSSDQCGVFFGANTLLNHGRCYYESDKPYLVPIQ